MGKRFTDTDKWKDEWYLSLDNDTRIVWQYILDNCTNAGRFKKNFKLLNFCCYVEIDEAKFIEIFGSRVVDFGSFFFLPKFLKFQYPKGLNSFKPAVVAIRDEIFQYGLLETIRERFGNDYLIIKETDTDTDKDKDTDKDTDKVVISLEERQKLIALYGTGPVKNYIERLRDYAGQFPKRFKKYASHYSTIRNWMRRDGVRRLPLQKEMPKQETRYDPNVKKLVSATAQKLKGAK